MKTVKNISNLGAVMRSSQLQKRRSAESEFQSLGAHGKRMSGEWRGNFNVKNEIDMMDGED